MNEFVFFGLTLLGIVLFHRWSLGLALAGLAATITYKWNGQGFNGVPGLQGFSQHLGHEWVTLANLFLLLLGFALLADHFEKSCLPRRLPRWLADDWKGGFQLLCLVFIISAFLDNIAAAMIGATIAAAVYQKRVHIGYLAAIVAASNAGGSGSVVGDTTTTMMWLAGIAPASVLPAYIAAGTALLVFGIPAARQQQAYSPIVKDEVSGEVIDHARLTIVALILLAAVATNVLANHYLGPWGERLPWLGLAVWVVLLSTAAWRAPDWAVLRAAIKGSVFLLALVTCASLMPVAQLPAASWKTALGLGFVSAVFDNIPLTALAIKQGGYDWGMLAYCVGFGGSMLWFGSSAGVAVSNQFPQARSAWAWLRGGWHVVLAYVVGFVVMWALWGWQPSARRVDLPSSAVVVPFSPS